MLLHKITLICDKFAEIRGWYRSHVNLCSQEHEYLCPGCNERILSPDDWTSTSEPLTDRSALWPYCSACTQSLLAANAPHVPEAHKEVSLNA